jgi:hypothetical protein
MFKYKLKQGSENRVFIGVQTLEDGTIQSESPILSPFVEEINNPSEPAQPLNQPAAAPAQVEPTAPVAQPQPTNNGVSQ